jgi:RNA polymerase-binding transcription factor DksA
VLDELCAAQRLGPCVGLVECGILTETQKRELLAARATRLREEEGRARSQLADAPDPRGSELSELEALLREEQRAIAQDNRRLLAEAAAAADWRGEQPARASEGFAALGISARVDEGLRALRSSRLDAIDRALDALAQGDRLACARCRRPIEVERLRRAPDSRVCEACAAAAAPTEGGPG